MKRVLLILTLLLCGYNASTSSAATVINQISLSVADDTPDIEGWTYIEGTEADPFLGKKATPGYYRQFTLGAGLSYYKERNRLVFWPRIPYKINAAQLPIKVGVYYSSTGKVSADGKPVTSKQPDFTKRVIAVNTGDGRSFVVSDAQFMNIIRTKKGVTRFQFTTPKHNNVVDYFNNPIIQTKTKDDGNSSAEYAQKYNEKDSVESEDDSNESELTPEEFESLIDSMVAAPQDNDVLDSVDNKTVSDSLYSHAFAHVEQMPAFPGGVVALNKFIYDHLVYPEASLENGVQGKVLLRFIVDENGSVGDVQILKSLDTYCDREAKRVVQMRPRFTPGRQQGKPVKVWFLLPITFAID